MPLPGSPHPKIVIQPLILVAFTLATISIVTTASPKPTKKPCTNALRRVSEAGEKDQRITTHPHTTPISAMKYV